MIKYVVQALTMINNIRSSIETANFRSEVLTGINEIQDQLTSIEEEIKSLNAKEDLLALRNEMQEADSDIISLFANKLAVAYLGANGDLETYHDTVWKSTYPDSSFDEFKKDMDQFLEGLDPDKIKQDLTNIDLAITGGYSSGAWGDLYYNKISLNTYEDKSIIEYMYLFFTDLINLQLKGLTLLSMIDDIGVYDDIVTENIKKQGEKFQDKLNSLPVSDAWPDISNGHINTRSSNKLRFGIDPSAVPEDYVVHGFCVRVDSNGKLILKLRIGELNEKGDIDVSTSKEVYQFGNTDDEWVWNTDESSGLTTNHEWGYLDTSLIDLPDNCVIINMGFGQNKSYESTKMIYGSNGSQIEEQYLHKGVHLVVRYAELDENGKVDTSKAGIVENGANFTNNGDTEGNPPAHWARYRSFTKEFNLNRPLTGARFATNDSGFVPVGKDTIHKNSFTVSDTDS